MGERMAARGSVLHRPLLGDERGMMLVLTMIVLLVLSTLAVTSLVNAYLEWSLARNTYRSAAALNAAEAGVSHAITWLNANVDAVPAKAGDAGWPGNLTNYCATPAVYGVNDFQQVFGPAAGFTDRSNGITYAVTLRLACDADNRDNDLPPGTNEILLFNNAPAQIGTGATRTGADGGFRFTDAVADQAGKGFPVVEIVSLGAGGTTSREVRLTVARNPLNVKAYGAITAGAGIGLSGSITVDGRAHDENGNLCSGGTCDCAESYAGVYLPTGATTTTNGNPTTTGEYDGASVGTMNSGALGAPPSSPDEALGLAKDNNHDGDYLDAGESNVGGPLDTFFSGLPAAGAEKTNGVFTYLNKDYSLAANSDGVLIVHNPLYNPAAWKVSTPPGLNTGDPDYDPRLDSTSAGYDAVFKASAAPRTFDMHGNNVFKGLIIADVVNKISGTPTVIGAVVSLSEIDVSQFGAGTANIYYSCDALNNFTSRSYNTKLAWRRVFDNP